MSSKANNLRGFTLVELLIVISIISILTMIGLTVYTGIIAKSRDSARKDDLQKLAIALELYSNQNDGLYIRRLPAGITSCPAAGSASSEFYTDITPYMNGDVPKDPLNGSLYCYISASGQTYTLCAKLENTADPAINNPADCSGYNFGITPR